MAAYDVVKITSNLPISFVAWFTSLPISLTRHFSETFINHWCELGRNICLLHRVPYSVCPSALNGIVLRIAPWDMLFNKPGIAANLNQCLHLVYPGTSVCNYSIMAARFYRRSDVVRELITDGSIESSTSEPSPISSENEQDVFDRQDDSSSIASSASSVSNTRRQPAPPSTSAPISQSSTPVNHAQSIRSLVTAVNRIQHQITKTGDQRSQHDQEVLERMTAIEQELKLLNEKTCSLPEARAETFEQNRKRTCHIDPALFVSLKILFLTIFLVINYI